MAKDLLLPGSILSLHRSAVEKLLKAGNGDAALLYLCLTAGQNSGALPWGPDQVEAAQNTLLRLGLISSDTPVQPPGRKSWRTTGPRTTPPRTSPRPSRTTGASRPWCRRWSRCWGRSSPPPTSDSLHPL